MQSKLVFFRIHSPFWMFKTVSVLYNSFDTFYSWNTTTQMVNLFCRDIRMSSTLINCCSNSLTFHEDILPSPPRSIHIFRNSVVLSSSLLGWPIRRFVPKQDTFCWANRLVCWSNPDTWSLCKKLLVKMAKVAWRRDEIMASVSGPEFI